MTGIPDHASAGADPAGTEAAVPAGPGQDQASPEPMSGADPVISPDAPQANSAADPVTDPDVRRARVAADPAAGPAADLPGEPPSLPNGHVLNRRYRLTGRIAAGGLG
ncbi:MAG: hypothetical protein LBV34_07365, partial [Nocardiopsaceae bacterium]|nr:hypothetical protein [Nocardiopsaceae bacterium]